MSNSLTVPRTPNRPRFLFSPPTGVMCGTACCLPSPELSPSTVQAPAHPPLTWAHACQGCSSRQMRASLQAALFGSLEPGASWASGLSPAHCLGLLASSSRCHCHHCPLQGCRRPDKRWRVRGLSGKLAFCRKGLPRKDCNRFTPLSYKGRLSATLQGLDIQFCFLLACWGLKLSLNNSRRAETY
jgi:hypothetical protein